MFSEKEALKISRFLSLVLRHKPETIGIELDDNGWTDVSLLLQKCNESGMKLDFEKLKYIVDTNNKKRFSFNESSSKIRANQGHSLIIDLDYEPMRPPELCATGMRTRPRQ